jgi:hypothetical protein
MVTGILYGSDASSTKLGFDDNGCYACIINEDAGRASVVICVPLLRCQFPAGLTRTLNIQMQYYSRASNQILLPR